MSILIVEDDPACAKILDTTLAKRKFRTIVARSGRDALEFLRDHRDVQLMITDLGMPEMGGLTLLRHLREIPAWSNLPVIICTVFGELQSVEEAAELGCTQYLLKPISKELLIRHVRQALGIRRKSPTPPTEARVRSLALKAS